MNIILLSLKVQSVALAHTYFPCVYVVNVFIDQFSIVTLRKHLSSTLVHVTAF